MKLEEWMEQQGCSRAELARRLDVTYQGVLPWVGGREPPRANMTKIRALTKGQVTEEDFAIRRPAWKRSVRVVSLGDLLNPPVAKAPEDPMPFDKERMDMLVAMMFNRRTPRACPVLVGYLRGVQDNMANNAERTAFMAGQFRQGKMARSYYESLIGTNPNSRHTQLRRSFRFGDTLRQHAADLFATEGDIAAATLLWKHPRVVSDESAFGLAETFRAMGRFPELVALLYTDGVVLAKGAGAATAWFLQQGADPGDVMDEITLAFDEAKQLVKFSETVRDQ